MVSKCDNINKSFDDLNSLKTKELTESEINQVYINHGITNTFCHNMTALVAENTMDNIECSIRRTDFCNKNYINNPELLKLCVDYISIKNVNQINKSTTNIDCHYKHLLNNQYARIASQITEKLDCSNETTKNLIDKNFSSVAECSNNIGVSQDNILTTCSVNDLTMFNNFTGSTNCVIDILDKSTADAIPLAGIPKSQGIPNWFKDNKIILIVGAVLLLIILFVFMYFMFGR